MRKVKSELVTGAEMKNGEDEAAAKAAAAETRIREEQMKKMSKYKKGFLESLLN